MKTSVVMWGLVLLMGLAANAHFLPEDRPQRESTTYRLEITELGTDFEESVIVDVTKNTEFIHVPQHNDVQESSFIIDYTRNVTVRLLPAVGRCYVSQLDEVSRQISSPQKLKQVLENAKGKSASDKTTLIRYNWRITGQLTSEHVTMGLSQEARDLCEGYPVYALEPLKDMVHVAGDSSRFPRQVIDNIGECFRGNQKLRCRRALGTASDRYIQVQTCEDVIHVREHRPYCEEKTVHIQDSITCCTPCCNDRDQANNETFPFCDNVGNGDIPGECQVPVSIFHIGCVPRNMKFRCLLRRGTLRTCESLNFPGRLNRIVHCVEDTPRDIRCCLDCCNDRDQADDEFFPFCHNIGAEDLRC